jgi:hypothetical protein
MRLEFIAETDHEVTGELGWKDSRVARNSPYGPLIGFGLAHDSLEHFALETVADEIMAHAAMYWGRYRAGYCNQYGRGLTLEDIGSEWINLFQAIQGGHNLTAPRNTRKLDDEIEEDISAIAEAGRRALRDEGFEFWQTAAGEIEQKFRGWFRIGFRKAEAKFRKMGIDPSELSHLFGQLVTRFEKLTPQWEGQKIVLIVNKDGFRLLEIEEEVY